MPALRRRPGRTKSGRAVSDAWRSPSLVDITNASFAHPKKAGAKTAARRRRCPSAAPRFSAGDAVTAQYPDGHRYDAVIRRVYRSTRRYLVAWLDGDTEHCSIPFAKVFPRCAAAAASAAPASTPQAEPEPVAARATAESARSQAVEAREQQASAPEPAAAAADEQPEEQTAQDAGELTWDAAAIAQLCATVKGVPISSESFWSHVAEGMRQHGLRGVSATECQQAYASRFPTPTRRRGKAAQPERGAPAALAAAAAAPVLSRPAARPGTLGWRRHVRSALIEDDRGHIDDLFDDTSSTTSTANASAAAASSHAVHSPASRLIAPGCSPAAGPSQEFLQPVDRERMDPYIARLQKHCRKQRQPTHTAAAAHAPPPKPAEPRPVEDQIALAMRRMPAPPASPASAAGHSRDSVGSLAGGSDDESDEEDNVF